MEHEAGTVTVAVMSALVLGFGMWIIHKINEI